jgi:hypothetical protein
MLTHFLTVYKLSKWAAKDIDHFWRSFLWRGEDPDKVKGGHCLVKWKIYIRPRKWGRIRHQRPREVSEALRLMVVVQMGHYRPPFERTFSGTKTS